MQQSTKPGKTRRGITDVLAMGLTLLPSASSVPHSPDGSQVLSTSATGSARGDPGIRIQAGKLAGPEPVEEAARAGESSANLWGALAIDSNQGPAWAWAVDYETVQLASQWALSYCGVQTCRVVMTFYNQCGAFAADQGQGSTIYGWAKTNGQEHGVGLLPATRRHVMHRTSVGLALRAPELRTRSQRITSISRRTWGMKHHKPAPLSRTVDFGV